MKIEVFTVNGTKITIETKDSPGVMVEPLIHTIIKEVQTATQLATTPSRWVDGSGHTFRKQR